MKYTYFVSCVFGSGPNHGYNNFVITRGSKIESRQDIDEIQEAIQTERGYSKVVIMHFSLLREEPVAAK